MDEYYEGAFSGPEIDDKLGNSTRQAAIAIVSDNNTHAAITSGQYVYVKSHGTLAEGLYQATTNISANATLSNSNLTAVNNGGLNALKIAIIDVKTVTGTFENSAAFVWLDYPTGFNMNNAVCVGIDVLISGEYRSGIGVASDTFGRCFVNLGSTPSVYNADPANYGKDFRITLLRLPS